MSTQQFEAVIQNRIAWHIECCDVMDGLRAIPSNSIHCVVTSPPYWSQRDYQVEPSIWGGDPECQHHWYSLSRQAVSEQRKWTQTVNGRGEKQGPIEEFRRKEYSQHTSMACESCGAWRGQLGLEPSVGMFIDHLVLIFQEVRRVLRKDGLLWVNMGDSYSSYRASSRPGSSLEALRDTARPDIPSGAGLLDPSVRPKNLIGQPWRLAFALQENGWYLRDDVIWHKRSPMPGSQKDRCTKAHEYVFMLSKSQQYYWDWFNALEKAVGNSPGNKSTSKHQAAYEAGDERHRTKAGLSNITAHAQRMPRSVWSLSSEGQSGSHFASFPTQLVERCLAPVVNECGVCADCGTPRKRIVSANRMATRPGTNGKVNGDNVNLFFVNRDSERHVTEYQHEGWAPCKCGCESLATPIILDPFSGTGTTGVVSRKLWARYIGIERSPVYHAESLSRIGAMMPLFDAIQQPSNAL